MEGFYHLMEGFAIAFQPMYLFYCCVGVLGGTLVGVLPAIGPASAIALLLPTAYSLDPTAAIILLAGIYYGSQYGGSTTSILVNIPGEASSIVTCLDGYPMALQGRAGAENPRLTGRGNSRPLPGRLLRSVRRRQFLALDPAQGVASVCGDAREDLGVTAHNVFQQKRIFRLIQEPSLSPPVVLHFDDREGH